MKIAFFLGGPNPFPGAGWTRIGFLANLWSKKANEIDILGAFSYSTLHKRGSKKFGNTTIFNLIFNLGINNPIFFIFNSVISLIVSTLFLISKKPDVAIVSVPTGDVGLGALIACVILKTKYVVDYRDEWEDRALNTSVNRIDKYFYHIVRQVMTYLYSKSCLIVTVTSIFLSNLKCRGIVNVVLIPNGADIAVFQQLNKSESRKVLNLSESDFVLVYSGIIGHYYNLGSVIKALAYLRGSFGPFKFLVVGEGSDLPVLKKLSTRLGLNDNIIYLGVKNNPREIAEILSASDVGVIPGLYTKGQLPVKFFEYCACGVPVIAVAPDDSILVNIIGKYKVGLSIPSLDEVNLAKSIHSLYVDLSFRTDAGKRAKALIEQKFDRNKTAERYLELIRGLVVKC